jgi:hypothetical protein
MRNAAPAGCPSAMRSRRQGKLVTRLQWRGNFVLTHTPHEQKERSGAKDKMKKLEEENLRLKRMLQAQQSGGPQDASASGGVAKKRKAAAEPDHTAKKPKGSEPASKPAGKKDATGKTKGKERDNGKESNFMKLIREQGLDKSSSGGQGGKTKMQMALEEDLREIEELKAKLGGNWRGELAEDGWLDLFDAMDNLGEDSGDEDPLGADDERGTVGSKEKKKASKVSKTETSKKTSKTAGKGKSVNFDVEEEEEDDDDDEDEDEDEDEDDEEEEEEGLFKAGAVNEEDPERDRATLSVLEF